LYSLQQLEGRRAGEGQAGLPQSHAKSYVSEKFEKWCVCNGLPSPAPKSIVSSLWVTPQRPLILFRLIGLVAEEAVISELVSARLFPVTWENTGKFAIFGFEIAEAPWLSEENSIA